MMMSFLFGSHGEPKTKEDGHTGDEASKDFDPNEESLSEGGEYADDALRMTEQPFGETI